MPAASNIVRVSRGVISTNICEHHTADFMQIAREMPADRRCVQSVCFGGFLLARVDHSIVFASDGPGIASGRYTVQVAPRDRRKGLDVIGGELAHVGPVVTHGNDPNHDMAATTEYPGPIAVHPSLGQAIHLGQPAHANHDHLGRGARFERHEMLIRTVLLLRPVRVDDKGCVGCGDCHDSLSVVTSV